MKLATPLKNDLLLRTLYQLPTERTPVWLMRQAGRYLPEYRKIREQAGSFMNLCRNPELATQVALQPLQRFPLDAAIVFSDILTIPDAMGLGLSFTENGPQFQHPIKTINDIDNLSDSCLEKLQYVMDTVKTTRHEIQGTIPLIGFAGSPWTLASYMVEGGSPGDFRQIKSLLYNHPNDLHRLLHKLTKIITNYLNEQIKHGAQIIQIFDTWGGVLAFDKYLTFSLNYMENIIQGLLPSYENRKIPTILFTKNSSSWLKNMAKTNAYAVSIDWSISIEEACQQITGKVLQGNMDPCVLYGNPDTIRTETQKILKNFSKHAKNRHIFNLGHGIQQYIKPENIAIMIDAIQNSNCI